MLMETQPAFDASSIPSPLTLDPSFSNAMPSGFQFFEKSEPIQIQVQIRLSMSTVPTTYSESAYHWLVEVLDGLIDFEKKHGHYGVIKLTEDEYQWLDDVIRRVNLFRW